MPPLQLAQLLEATQKERKQKAEAGEAPATVHAVQASESKLLSMLGRLQLQVGNVAAAEDAYAQLECLIADADEHPDVRLNRGFLAVALGDYEAALPEFEAVLALDPSHAAAANNAAVCQLYCCRLPDAIRTLEGFLRADPARNTQQAVVANLGALYAMTDGGASSKATLERVASAFGADDFDATLLAMAPNASGTT